MPSVICNSCGGEYETVQKDGTRYYHACPDVIEYRNAAGDVVDGKAASALVDAGKLVNAREIPRVNPRDENIAVDKSGKATGVKAAGAGAAPR